MQPPFPHRQAGGSDASSYGRRKSRVQHPKAMEEKAKREGTAVKVNCAEGVKVVEAAHRDAQGGI